MVVVLASSILAKNCYQGFGEMTLGEEEATLDASGLVRHEEDEVIQDRTTHRGLVEKEVQAVMGAHYSLAIVPVEGTRQGAR